MNLIDDEEVNNKNNKKSKIIMKIIIACIVLLIILSIALIYMINNIKTSMLKIDQLASFQRIYL
jgi:flagellar basal body-associated protein FliL